MATAARPVPAPGVRLVLRDWRGLDDTDIARWDALALAAAEPNPFFESWYLLPSLRALDADGEVALAVLEGDGEWLGLLQLVREARYYGHPLSHWRGWVHANAFLGAPLVARGHEEPFWRALLHGLDGMGGGPLFLHLAALPLGGALHEALVDVARTERRPLGLVHREDRALLASGLAPDAYLESALTGKKRKELRRQFARLSEEGVLAVERRDDADGLAAWTEAFLRLEASGWKGKAASALACAPETAAIFRAALSGAAERGRLERLALTLDDRPIAMLASFLTPPGAFSYKTAFDESLARFSPGVLLQRENLALLEREGIAWCDSCAAADHPMIDHLWRERRAVGRVSVAIGGRLRRTAFSLLLAAELGRRPAGVSG